MAFAPGRKDHRQQEAGRRNTLLEQQLLLQQRKVLAIAPAGNRQCPLLLNAILGNIGLRLDRPIDDIVHVADLSANISLEVALYDHAAAAGPWPSLAETDKAHWRLGRTFSHKMWLQVLSGCQPDASAPCRSRRRGQNYPTHGRQSLVPLYPGYTRPVVSRL